MQILETQKSILFPDDENVFCVKLLVVVRNSHSPYFVLSNMWDPHGPFSSKVGLASAVGLLYCLSLDPATAFWRICKNGLNIYDNNKEYINKNPCTINTGKIARFSWPREKNKLHEPHARLNGLKLYGFIVIIFFFCRHGLNAAQPNDDYTMRITGLLEFEAAFAENYVYDIR